MKLAALAATASLVLGCKSECDAKVDEVDRIADAPATCTTDAECGCFSGGVSSKHGCGGVTTRDRAQQIEAIAKDFRKSGCKSRVDCAAWMCLPICEKGVCANGPRKQP